MRCLVCRHCRRLVALGASAMRLPAQNQMLVVCDKSASFRQPAPRSVAASAMIGLASALDAEHAVNVQRVMPWTRLESSRRHASPMHSIVQIPRHQRAAPAALPLLTGQRGTPGVRLAAARSRARGGPEKSEGKIKGLARRGLPSESARWFGAARHFLVLVPRRSSRLRRRWVCRVPCSMCCDRLRPTTRSRPCVLKRTTRVKPGRPRPAIRTSLRHVSLPPFLPNRGPSHPRSVSLRSCGK